MGKRIRYGQTVIMETDYILQYHNYKGELKTLLTTGGTVEEALTGVNIPQEALENDFTLHKVSSTYTKKELVDSGGYDDVIPE